MSYPRPRFGGKRQQFSGRSNQRFAGNRGGKIRYMRVDPRMLIKKAEPTVESEYTPKHSFAEFNLAPVVLENVIHKGYRQPSPIQDMAIPLIMSNQDVVGLAATGTGKTAAFMLPLISKVLADPTKKALIVTPTRELAIQIVDEGLYFSRGTRVYFSLVIGGANIKRQMNELMRRPEFVVGTPGRLKDLMNRKVLNLANYNIVVLDEVDRMLDMGFIRDIRTLIGQMPKDRHSLFFSATMNQDAKLVASEFLRDPAVVEVSTEQASNNVDQDVVYVQGRQKIEVLHELLIKPGFDKVLVFGRTKHGMEKLSKTLSERGFATASIHGNKSQNQRQNALREFKNNRVQVLLATDVASRGLDINEVTHVINYELPETYQDYIHRIGRTGRAGKTGVALTLID